MRILLIGKPGVLVILAPALAGAVLALWQSRSRGAIGLACGLTFATALVSLIGGVGLLYLPTMVLFVLALVTDPSPTSQATLPEEADAAGEHS
jgi:hypothetical protein